MTSDIFRIARARKFLTLIESRIVRESVAASDIRKWEPAQSRFDVPPDEGDWQPFAVRGFWGIKQTFMCLRGAVRPPEGWKRGAIELRLGHVIRYLERPTDDTFPAGPEGFVFIDGQRVGAIDIRHTAVRHPFERGRVYDVRAVFFAGRCACRHELETFELAWVDTPTEKLYHDLRVTLDVIEALDEKSITREKLIAACESAVRRIDVRGVGGEFGQLPRAAGSPEEQAFYDSVPTAQAAFDEAQWRIEPAPDVPRILAVGHAHIDLGWLWPYLQTRHKCVRTFSTQCRLLEQFPDWTFLQSQAQACKWVQSDAPELFERIRGFVEAGRWEVEGALWCECDTNVPGGESLVRQLLYGKRYFRETFGVDAKVVWLPDVFGYSGALPQLMRQAGVIGFVTSKISWNETNRFPHDTFRWRGIDGTEVPTHFITTPGSQWYFTYNASMTVEQVKGIHDVYRQKRLGFEPLMSFGHGDGGGGPTEEMLETASRLAAWPAMSGLPQVTFGKVADLMGRIADASDRLPVWDGELYLEYHRGTYTSQGWLKRANRKNEVRLHDLECLAALAAPHGYGLDKGKLDAMWEDLLLCQFHDVLPGSSVGEVYEDTKRMQDAVTEGCDAMIAEAADAVATKIDTSGCERPIVLFNTLSWDRCDPVRLPGGVWRDDVTVPACGWTVIDAAAPVGENDFPELSVSDDGREVRNAYWILHLDNEGRVSRLHDRINNREVLPKGALGNAWQLFVDRPRGNDAWNLDEGYVEFPLDPPTCEWIEVVERGDVRVAVEIRGSVPSVKGEPQSTITQRIALYARQARIDFETTVDWHEHHQLLKVAFPAAVRATEATYEIQFGHLRRPTHRNTSWDEARFECCAQRFVDVAEHGYGVALMNDCKYGHDVRENVIRLTCIKCAQSPHAQADQGRHEFTYSLLPHTGTFQEAGVIRAAAELNVPVIACEVSPSSGPLPREQRFVDCAGSGAVIDTVKPAEDGDGVILRLYESHGARGRATLLFAMDLASVEPVDLLEQPLPEEAGRALELTRDGDHCVALKLKPFQVVSLRVRFKT